MSATLNGNGTKLKAWLAPGIILSAIVMVLSFLSSYAGRQRADGEAQQQMKDMARQIAELKEQVERDNNSLLSKAQFEEYVRGRVMSDKTLTDILQDIRNHQK